MAAREDTYNEKQLKQTEHYKPNKFKENSVNQPFQCFAINSSCECDHLGFGHSFNLCQSKTIHTKFDSYYQSGLRENLKIFRWIKRMFSNISANYSKFIISTYMFILVKRLINWFIDCFTDWMGFYISVKNISSIQNVTSCRWSPHNFNLGGALRAICREGSLACYCYHDIIHLF